MESRHERKAFTDTVTIIREERFNWFKIFTHMDLDESGRIGFEELEGVTRARDPGLNLDEERLSLADLRSFWKALDLSCYTLQLLADALLAGGGVSGDVLAVLCAVTLLLFTFRVISFVRVFDEMGALVRMIVKIAAAGASNTGPY